MEVKRKWSWGDKDANGAITYPVHAGQADILRSKARFTVACAGTGGGKTAIGPLWVMRKIQETIEKVRTGERLPFSREPMLGMVLAPTYPVLSRATVPTLITMFQGTDFEGRYVESQNKYYLPNKLGTIWTLSADNPGGLEGGQFDWIWGDEMGQAKYAAHVAIEGRTGAKEAPVLYTTTPYGLNWLYHKVVKKWKAGACEYYVRQWSSIMNPRYPKAEYERAKAGMSLQRGAQRYDGEFVKMAGLVYPDLDSCFVPPFAPPIGQRHGGIDFGWNDPFVCLAGVIDEQDVLHVWFERYKRLCNISQHAPRLPQGYTYYADPSRPDSIRELRVGGHTVLPALNAITEGVDAVNDRIYTGRLKISERCKAVFSEKDEYRYPEKDDEIIGEKPVDEMNHAMDALRYMIMGIDKGAMVEGHETEEMTAEQELLEQTMSEQMQLDGV